MQEINGRLTTLGRFITKSAEKALPLFQTLKGCIDKNKFKWRLEANKALQQLKIALHQVQALASPLLGETLQMYLVVSGEAISFVLVLERNKKQLPIQFMIRVLQGTELNYLILEKLVLTLIYVAMQLRHYFQAHKIEVLTSYLIKQILLSPVKSGHLAKWVIKLGEHDIDYRPCTDIKAQALADFLVEILDTLRYTSAVLPIDPSKQEGESGCLGIKH